MDILKIIGRKNYLFGKDIFEYESEILNLVSKSKFLILGGAGSIGQAVVKEIFKRGPKLIHVVDLSENNLVELVRDLRSSIGYMPGEFKTFVLDIGSWQFETFFNRENAYDYVLNLSALKHVRSEKDIYTLLRMIEVNILNTNRSIEQSISKGVKKYFCVSTDKATNPVNMMGASKRIMEMFLANYSSEISISTSRFANVAFSDGSLLHGFNQRIQKNQPIVAPKDVKRYFITPKESGELCLFSALFGKEREIFFPKLNDLKLTTFSDIAINYLDELGFKPLICENEEDARRATKLKSNEEWPCLFADSDTTGEKSFEEFFTDNEKLDLDRFESFGVITSNLDYEEDKLKNFSSRIENIINEKFTTKDELIKLFCQMIPNFKHDEKGKYLDAKM